VHLRFLNFSQKQNGDILGTVALKNKQKMTIKNKDFHARNSIIFMLGYKKIGGCIDGA